MRFLVVFSLVFMVGCRPPESPERATGNNGSDAGVRVSLELPQEPAVGPADVRVYLLGTDNEAVSDASITVTGTMTHAGMEPVITEAVPTEDGLYQTEDFEFTMAGDWLLEADVTLADGGEAGDEMAVTVPGE